jgi:hypothetical protein
MNGKGNVNLNINRNRYYGLRVGDIVKCEAFKIKKAEVFELGYMDNNAVYVLVDGKATPTKVVAEWCEITTKVEDR